MIWQVDIIAKIVFSDNYVDLSDNDVDLSDHHDDLSDIMSTSQIILLVTSQNKDLTN